VTPQNWEIRPVTVTGRVPLLFSTHTSRHFLSLKGPIQPKDIHLQMDRELHVKVFREIADLETIRPIWESWPGNRDSELDSYLTFLRSNPGSVRPHVVVVYRDAAPDAILVGRMDIDSIRCRLGYLRLDLPAKILCFVYGALRGNPSRENCDLIVNSILESLSSREADAAYMNFIRQDSDLCRISLKKPSPLSRDYIQITQPHFAATLPASVESFYKGLSSGARWQTKSKQKKLLKAYGDKAKIRCFRDGSELDAMVQDLEYVAKKSYQRGLGVGFNDGPETRESLRLLASKGRLRAYVLYLADRPCAFWVGDINGNTFGSDWLAFDSEFAKYSPGMFLILKVIEGFCDGNREGVTAVDFATGHAQYKEVLSNQEWRETCSYIFAPTLKGISLNFAWTLIGGMDKAIKKALSSTGFLQRIKKGWRARARPQEAAQG